ncbi:MULTISPECIES: PHB depolymerase family esterase [unclassified Acidovorax]|uniref:extracellular catalytic domain type 1 short-chain-length polyhydroxyalkanoate depolymerase n=1 Tax=unclassified Acidovorax TaxID=2684926 RepID=UPI001C47E14F|nr:MULTISPECIES: PHB depolymerase family esterase [unclassified Acidovorax]MBV7459006.1 PHB depolymerase family esterase [Acidovorax sp. sif0632]MBV7463172.1 PHB depolymerase family esterase [Acidovorax sp. sif0613]
MVRRSRLFSLSALTRAYQRNLKAFARAARPVRAKAPAAPRRVVPAPAVPARRAASKPVPARGEWVGGVAPGPAGARRYHLYIPPGLALKADEKLPLLVMLHGCGQTGGDLAAATRMNRLAARERFLVLYPEQERMANAHGCWNWFERRNGKAQAEAATLLAAVDKVARRYPVDLARVAVAGLSAGASMAVLMAALYPQRFCAVAMHSGVAPGTAESAATALAAMHGRRAAHLPEPLGVSLNQGATPSVLPLPPLLVLHGDADGVVSVRNAAATALLWADALGARAGALRTLQRGQRHAMRVTEFKTRGRTVVALREVAGLAHAWSGGVAQLPFSDPAGPDASALVWAFVARQFAKK